MAEEAVRVEGLSDLLRALQVVGGEVQSAVVDELRSIGQRVRDDASWKFDRYSTRSAAGYRVVVRQRGVSVEQQLRKTTGRRGDYGALQMREALLPALNDRANEIERRVGQVVERVNRTHF